jgi:hypothetical protein
MHIEEQSPDSHGGLEPFDESGSSRVPNYSCSCRLRRKGVGKSLSATKPSVPTNKIAYDLLGCTQRRLSLSGRPGPCRENGWQSSSAAVWPTGNHGKLDHIVITTAHPDATIAMLTAQRDVTANFSSVPFQYRQQKQAGIHQLMTSTDILGGPEAFNIVATTTKLRTEHPKLNAAFLGALKEATAMVNKDKAWAAEAYLCISKDKMPLDELLEIVPHPDVEFMTKLAPIDSIIQFMARTGSYKNKPKSAAELLFPEAL